MTQTTKSDHDQGLLLPGLDGANPLGFLAALGLFHILDTASAPGQLRIMWHAGGGTWIPSIHGISLSQESVINLLKSNLVSNIEQHPVHILDQIGEENLSYRTKIFDIQAREACTSDRIDADWLASLASDIAPPSAINQLQTTRRDYHYGNLTSIISKTSAEHLRRTIFSSWDYADPLDNQSLHIDPSEDRRHAHQWNKPAGDPARKAFGGMLGANRLAIEAFVMFTSLPIGDALHTIGFTGQRSTNTRWTWPIWNVPLSIAVVRSLLMLAELQEDDLPADLCARILGRGVVAAYRSSRILVGKTPNFTPAQRIA